MSEPQKKISEEELEKQYEDYRAQFEQWKENNKSSIGTEAYNAYVNQFEQWEKEVELRKAQQRRQKIASATAIDEKEAAAAAAYAQSQEAYMAHHMKAMEQAEQHRAAQVVAQQHMMNAMSRRHAAESVAHPDLFFRDGINGLTATSSANGNVMHTQSIASPPTLWGNPRPLYDGRDPLFAKWGLRAATSHTKVEADSYLNPVACWMLLDTLREKKMVLAPHSSSAPPPIVINPVPLI